MNNSIKSHIDKIANFDKKSLNDYIDSMTLNSEISKFDVLLKQINDEYYTFKPLPEKNKKYFRLKSVVFSQLFKFSYRQIHFNDYVRRLFTQVIEELRIHSSRLARLEDKVKELEEKIQTIDIQNSISEIRSQVNSLTIASEYKQENKRISNSSYKSGFNLFFSQFGEDEWLSQQMDLPKSGIFLDIGAANGLTYSNSFYFELKGWRTICIEPNPEQLEKLFRYRHEVLPLAVMPSDGKVDLYLSDISPDWASTKKNDHQRKIEVTGISFSKIIKKLSLRSLDIVSIDTEGTEKDLILSFPFNLLTPKYFIVEYLHPGLSLEETNTNISVLEKIFATYNYFSVYQTKANLIFKYQVRSTK